MNLIKTSALNGIAVTVKMFTYLAINKILAIYVGPSGYVALGQFQNAIQIITTFASGAINTGVTKYTAEYFDDEIYQRKVWQTSGKIIILGSILVSFFIAVFSKKFSYWFLGNESFQDVFFWLSGSLLFANLNIFFLAILNGKKAIKLYVVANIVGSLVTLLLTGLMSYFWGIKGALVSLTLYQSLSFFVTFCICLRTNWFRVEYVYGPINKEIFKNLIKYTAMFATSACCVPLTQMLIRNLISQKFGLGVAGYWEAMNRLSAAYLMMATSTLSVYLLPRFSEIKENSELKKEIINIIKTLIPFVVLSGVGLFVFKDVIIRLMFTSDFSPMRQLFLWQVLGDSFKITSWILAYVLLSKAFFKVFIISEICFSISLYLITSFLIGKYDFEYISFGYFCNYVMYLIFLAIYLRRKNIL